MDSTASSEANAETVRHIDALAEFFRDYDLGTYRDYDLNTYELAGNQCLAVIYPGRTWLRGTDNYPYIRCCGKWHRAAQWPAHAGKDPEAHVIESAFMSNMRLPEQQV